MGTQRKPFVYTAEIRSWLVQNYPELGPTACAKHFGDVAFTKRIRAWAHRNGVKWVRIGKPRPNDQRAVMKRLWAEGKIVKKSAEESKENGASFSARLRSGELQHPRGMKGKPQTDYCKHASRERAKQKVKDGTHPFQQPRTVARREAQSALMHQRMKTPGAVYSHARRGVRGDIGEWFFRSRWEANYARYLTLLAVTGRIAKWEYEVDTFWFETIRRGVRSYTPDFKVHGVDGTVWYEEVKGWMDAKSKTKLKRMKKYYPNVTVVVIGETDYRALEKTVAKTIPHWEFK